MIKNRTNIDEKDKWVLPEKLSIQVYDEINNAVAGTTQTSTPDQYEKIGKQTQVK